MTRRNAIRLAPYLAAPLAAQQEGGNGAFRADLERAAEQILRRAEGETASRTVWEPLRAQRRRELLDMLGLMPLPGRTGLQAQITGTLERDDYTIERLTFQSVPGFYVTSNLYLPKPRQGKAPVIVYVCGHAMTPPGAKTAYQRHGISFARNGYACLILDPIQIAEPFAIHHGIHAMEMYDWYSRGYTPAGPEVWNAMRALDYLATRPEIDMGRVGMTGRSGGAAMTWFTAAVDERVHVAAPVMGISTYLANLRENTQRLHCDCMFPINFHRHDMLHQGALIAPRPLLMAHGSKDALFPVAGYTKFEEAMRKLYVSYGPPERFRNVVVETGHQDSDFLRETVLRWMDEHLLKIAPRELKMEYRNADPETLRVFQGKVPREATNPRIHLLFRPAAKLTAPASRGAWEKRKSELLAILREKVFGGFPAVTGAPEVRASFEDRIRFETEPGVELRMTVRKPARGKGRNPAVLYLAPVGEDAGHSANLLRLSGISEEHVQAILYARDWSATAPNSIERRDRIKNAMLLGRTPDSMRVFDLMRAFEVLRSHPAVDGSRIAVAGKGTDAGVAVYAAALEERIAGAVLVMPVDSHWSGPVMLNALRYTDLAEAAALVAPRRLTFLGRMPESYTFTRRVYGLLDASGAIEETTTVTA